MNETTMTGEVSPVKINVAAEFGDGRYSNAMRELFHDSQRALGISQPQALKLAKAFGAELGRHNAQSSIRFGKVNKDGKITLSESAKLKGLTMTYAVSLAKLTTLLHEARTYGLEDADVTLANLHLEWLNK